MAHKATKSKKSEKMKCIVSTPMGQGVTIDHKICWRGEEVTPEDVGMTRLMLAEGQLLRAGTHDANELLKAVKKEKTADKKVASETGHLSKDEGKELEQKAIAEKKRADEAVEKAAELEEKVAKLEKGGAA